MEGFIDRQAFVDRFGLSKERIGTAFASQRCNAVVSSTFFSETFVVSVFFDYLCAICATRSRKSNYLALSGGV